MILLRRSSSLLAVIIALPLYAETPDQLFDEANQAYRQAKYAEAIKKYEQIIEGNTSGETYYNLGNAYYKSGNIGKAILNYERATKWLANDDDVRHNLQLANLMITDRIEAVPGLFVWEWWDAIKSAWTLNGITWLAYMFFVGVIGAVIVAILAPSYAWRRAAFFAGTASLLLLIFSITIFVAKADSLQKADNAIVIANITTVKNSPDMNSTDAFVLHSGIKVSIIDKVTTWFNIRLADGKVGWMEQSAAEII